MKKEKVLIVRITEDQEKIPEAKASSAGFIKKSDYVRYVLFMPINTSDMIQQTKDCYSVSTFIQMAIKEKLERRDKLY